MNKKEFRKKYKELREQISEEELEDLSIEIANNALKLPIWDFDNYHIFLPIPNKKEVNTEYLLHILQGKDKSIIVPKVHIETGELSHILLQDNTLLKPSNYKVPEPVSGIEISPPQINVVFVPLLAYDKKGNRLGYGKGFYDRFLVKCKPETIFIGLSLFEPEDEIPIEETDVPLHFCVTPKNSFRFKKT
ncbi:MAG: 5-formyltetrahydrofolate cyclo-ligase [Flavobacterium sp.]|nr:MAG: 5-formyltetrahydrofolate cyclo-ligase [Flavobacterium sp.]